MSWGECKNILCIRPDNMGDLLMSGPAIRALKESFNAKITILTSSMAAGIARFMPEIDEVLIFDVPWVKSAIETEPEVFYHTVELIKQKAFDAAVVFTVFSQNPLPTAMLAYLAGIPRILAYCRENPYELINYWVSDKEPYQYIKHQVERDLDLVRSVGATTGNDCLQLNINDALWPTLSQKLLEQFGLNTSLPWLILHPGVSEKKREYPINSWAETGKALIQKGYQLLITGSLSEKHLTDELAGKIGDGSHSAGGAFSLEEFICLVSNAPLLISVNTGTIHIAAATQTPVVVLYAQTNPQHTPWKVPNVVLPFSISQQLRSKNEVVNYLSNTLYAEDIPHPPASLIVNAAETLLESK